MPDITSNRIKLIKDLPVADLFNSFELIPVVQQGTTKQAKILDVGLYTKTLDYATWVYANTSNLSIVNSITAPNLSSSNFSLFTSQSGNPIFFIGQSGLSGLSGFNTVYDLNENKYYISTLGFNGSPLTAITITRTGNVGIFTANPNERLTINGNISSSSVIYDSVGNSVNWNSVYSNVNSNSSNFLQSQTFVNSNSSNILQVNTKVNTTSANWDSVYSTWNSNSSFDLEARTFVNANSSNIRQVNSTVNTTSANWNSVYSNVNSNSSNFLQSQTFVNSNSSNILQVNSTVNTTSANWNSVYSNVNSNSSNFLQSQTFVNSNSSNILQVNSTVNTTSANWNSVYSTWNSNSSFDLEARTFINSNSANIRQVNSTVNTTSANWNSVYSNVNSNSSNFLQSQTFVNSNSSNILQVNSTVNNTSANWNSVYSNVNTISANWNSVYSSVCATSANWNSVFSNVRTNSATYATITFADSKFLPLSGGTVTSLYVTNLTANNFTQNIVQPATSTTLGVSFSASIGTNLQVGTFANIGTSLTVGTSISSGNIIYDSVGNSVNWNSVYSTWNSNSSFDLAARTFINSNSANILQVNSIVNTTSANWNSVFSTWNSNSSFDLEARTFVNSNSSNIRQVNSTVNTTSANWNSVYSNVNSNSSNFLQSQTFVNSNSSNILQVNSTVNITSANWNSVYSNVNSNSSTYATYNYVNNGFLPLSGGTISGATRINNNLTVFGNLSTTGTAYFSNTIYSTTSALSVINVGNTGPALYVGNNGTGDIASFVDLDQNVEVFHIGGSNGSFPNVGVKTSAPNVDFTVNGQISANNTIWSANGNSNNWNSVYSTWNSNSSLDLEARTFVNSNSSNIRQVNTKVNTTSANWDSVYSQTNLLSANWNSGSGFQSQSANNASVYSYVNANSARYILNGSSSTGIIAITNMLTGNSATPTLLSAIPITIVPINSSSNVLTLTSPSTAATILNLINTSPARFGESGHLWQIGAMGGGDTGANTWPNGSFAPNGGITFYNVTKNISPFHLGFNSATFTIPVTFNNSINVPTINNSGSNVNLVTTSGNVGIGTTTPNQRLTVNGTISANNLSVPSISSRFINLEHSTPNDGINPVLFIGERGDGTGGTVVNSLSGFNTTYDETTNNLNITTQFGSVTPVNAVSITSSGNVGIGTSSPNVRLEISGTNAIRIPIGTTGERPTGATGYIRFNSTTSKYEGYGTSTWGALGGGATGGGTDSVFYENDKTVNTNYTITSGKNAMSAGPITIANGVTVTIPDGSTYTVV